jgi:hypothetical protein
LIIPLKNFPYTKDKDAMRRSKGLDEEVGVVLSCGAEVLTNGELRYPEERASPDYRFEPVVRDTDFNRPLSDIEQQVFSSLLTNQKIVGNPTISMKKRKKAVEHLNSTLVWLSENYGIDYAYFFLTKLKNKIGHTPALCDVVIKVVEDYEKFEAKQKLPYYRREEYGALDPTYGRL